MPSSVGHMLGGWAAVRLLGGQGIRSLPYVGAAVAPDLDVAVQLARKRRPVSYEHRRTHSVGAVLVAGALAGATTRLLGGRAWSGALTGAAAYASHLLLDYFGKDSEDGLPLLWPLSERHFAAPRPVFRTIYTRRDQFIAGLFTARNLRRVVREVAIILPVIVVVELGRRRAGTDG